MMQNLRWSDSFHHKKEKSELMHLITLEACLPSFLKEVFLKALRRNEPAGFILKFFDNLKSKQYSASILNMNFLNYSKEY